MASNSGNLLPGPPVWYKTSSIPILWLFRFVAKGSRLFKGVVRDLFAAVFEATF